MAILPERLGAVNVEALDLLDLALRHCEDRDPSIEDLRAVLALARVAYPPGSAAVRLLALCMWTLDRRVRA